VIELSPVSIQTQSLALASSQSWLPLLRQNIPIGWRLRLLREIQRKRMRFLRFGFRLCNARNASDCVRMETGLESESSLQESKMT